MPMHVPQLQAKTRGLRPGIFREILDDVAWRILSKAHPDGQQYDNNFPSGQGSSTKECKNEK